MNIESKNYRAQAGKRFRMKDWPTLEKPLYSSKEHYKKQLGETIESLDELQNLLYAASNHAVLLIFQAMDAAGKDSIIRNVMSGINPQGCSVHSFKQPSLTELKHDFLWRTTLKLPEKGMIGVFNRSYYEEVLVVRVHPEILGNAGITAPKGDSLWQERYESINGFEKHLSRNGTTILKFFLHVSKEEQARRFLSRIEEPSKNWKFSLQDVKEREHWNEYQKAYAACIEATGTAHAPWYVIPADDKKNARLVVAHIFAETLKNLPMKYPDALPGHKKEIQLIRKKLSAEVD